jgi:repressor LexA
MAAMEGVSPGGLTARLGGGVGERSFHERLFVEQHRHERPFVVKPACEQMFARTGARCYGDTDHLFASGRHEPGGPMADTTLTARQRQILECIDTAMRDRGYPPSVREIGESVGLGSPSTVHSHLSTLQRLGYLRRDPTKPRAIEVRWDSASGAAVERRPVRHVPLVGEVAAGTDVLAQENVEEVIPVPADLTGEGELFMLRVRGDSMIDAGILDGDLVVARSETEAKIGEIVVAGIPGEEATVKTFRRQGDQVVLVPSNERLQPMVFDPSEVQIFGRVVTVMRRL